MLNLTIGITPVAAVSGGAGPCQQGCGIVFEIVPAR
jgi:hypothetical protein